MLSSEKDHKKMILLKLQQSIIFKVAQVNAEITGSISEIVKKMSLVRYETSTLNYFLNCLMTVKIIFIFTLKDYLMEDQRRSKVCII